LELEGIKNPAVSRGVFVACLIFCCSPYASPPLALATGLLAAVSFGNPYKRITGKATKYLLQLSVVGLGFGMNFGEVIAAGKTGILITVFSIFGTLAAGYLLGKWLSVSRNTSHLISAGTAICGGSAIAAIAPIIGADEKEISVSLGTVFILNSIALFLFPVIGHFVGLSQHQFGFWSAIAIHDTSSVVGAASRYGAEALKIATTVKLTRALWIVPLSLMAAVAFKNKASKISIPYFIFAFVAASIIVSAAPGFKPFYGSVVHGAKIGLTLTLFMIGAGLSRETLKTVGIKPIVQGTLLWALISIISLLMIKAV
jgi:uncharacterized integral membrane protein (TIGR00698 family)